MQQNFNTLLQTIQHYKLFPPNSTLLIAVSGGADSLALLHWFASHQTLLKLSLHVATLNHGARAEASADVRFVQDIASKFQLACTAAYVDVPALVAQQQISFETAARKARYDFLAETAQKIKASHIVTAHHADDQSETLLMHILRGSGTQGLIGMQMISQLPYHPQMTLVRPLLQIRRAEIESYCAQHGLKARTDPSNFDTQYFRNEIRHEILPRLRQINPQIDLALARLAEISRTEQDYMAKNYQANFKKRAKFADRVSVSLKLFQEWHIAMQRRFLLDALAHLNIEPSFEHIQNAIALAMKGQVGAIAEFSGDVRLRLDYETVHIEPLSLALPTEDYVQIDKTYQINIPGETIIGDWRLIVSKDALPDYDACLSIPEDAKVSLRTRQAGDRIKPKGMGGHSRKIKACLIDKKIPSFVRDALPIVIIGNTIGAIMLPQGWCIAEEFAKYETSQYNFYFKVSNL